MYVYTYTQVALYLQYIGERLCVFKCVSAYFENKQVHTPIYRTLVYACIYPHFFFFFFCRFITQLPKLLVYIQPYMCVYTIHLYLYICIKMYVDWYIGNNPSGHPSPLGLKFIYC